MNRMINKSIKDIINILDKQKLLILNLHFSPLISNNIRTNLTLIYCINTWQKKNYIEKSETDFKSF
jgi:hypothetical protein